MLNFETCVCCGDVIPEGIHVCRKCVREIEKGHTCIHKACNHWNDNGLFCELTGIECIGLGCQSYDKTED